MTARPGGHAGSFDYDAELRRHHVHLRAAAAVGPHDRVLDVGCGTGLTTREAARAAAAGSAVGVDVSAPALERARRISAEEGLRNVSFLRADAQVHRFPPESFDVCISRFGTMFFADPVAAFTTIGLALRPGARLVLLVWQGAERNEWSSAIWPALTGGTSAPGPTGGPDPFSLADPAATRRILTAAGFAGITFTDVHEPVYYGPDVTAALDAVLALYGHTGLTGTEQARRRLRAVLAAHETDTGVWFDARAWLVTARRGA